MPSVLLFPLLPLLMEIIFLLYWLAVCILLYSTGEVVMKYRGTPPGSEFPASTPTPGPTSGPADITNITDVLGVVDSTAQEVFLE
eukprot:scaffold622358_cov45-Prasinocladus_malaysianus.AAC.1